MMETPKRFYTWSDWQNPLGFYIETLHYIYITLYVMSRCHVVGSLDVCINKQD